MFATYPRSRMPRATHVAAGQEEHRQNQQDRRQDQERNTLRGCHQVRAPQETKPRHWHQQVDAAQQAIRTHVDFVIYRREVAASPREVTNSTIIDIRDSEDTTSPFIAKRKCPIKHSHPPTVSTTHKDITTTRMTRTWIDHDREQKRSFIRQHPD